MKNARLITLWAVFMMLAVLSALALLNNISVTCRWWRAFFAAGGDSSGIPGRIGGFLPWLDWSAVDHSVVTTLIPFIGFCSISVSLTRMLFGCRMRVGDFPFFRGSDQLNVALGLFGTLWGIIVIGYFRLDTVTMGDLMQCLHTALFSTLMAVVWVFLLDRPLLRPLLTQALVSSGLAESDDGDLAAAVDRLVVRLGKAGDAFDARQRAYESAFEKRLASYEREFDERQREYVDFFRRRIDELEKRAADSENRLKAVAEALGGRL